MTKNNVRNVDVLTDGDGVRWVELSSLIDRKTDTGKRHYRAVVRAIRNGDVPGQKRFGRLLVHETFNVFTVDIPDGTSRLGRDDGRERCVVWLNDTEQTLFAQWRHDNGVPDDAFLSPEQRRANAKKRRDARKQKNANTDTHDDTHDDDDDDTDTE